MLYSQAEIIKHHRKLKGLTQEQLAEGICSRMHVMNAENGKRKLSAFIFRDVLQKLDLNPVDFNFGINAESEEMIFLLQMEQEFKLYLEQLNKASIEKIKNVEVQ
ncbi:MAG: helix-turn-helix domain-containing protein [Turicibacter sp.]|nr:helix-turn-helix domain-containing protein [Turicibacter sp.]